MASSSVSSQGSPKYDVFLNFRGEDVRFNFLSYLILAFSHASLNFFVDYNLERGEHIETALMVAIQDSRVALTIFSKGYASSEWCLDELVKIMQCRENPTLKQKVIPVFYHVTPSDVTNVETGVFAQDFAKHENDYRSHSKVPRWKAAMKAAGSLSGRIVNETSAEADVLIQIVDDVLRRVRRNNPIWNPGEKELFHASTRHKLDVFLHNLNGKLKDCPNIQQQQRNGSIWTISRPQGLPVQKDLNEFLMDILMAMRIQVEGKSSQSHSGQRSETSNSHPSPHISYHYGVNPYGLGRPMIPTNPVTQAGLPMSSCTFACGGGNNTNGYRLGGTTVPYSSVSMPNGNCGYRLDLGTGNWGNGYPVAYGNGYCGYPPVDYCGYPPVDYCGYPPVDYGNGYCGYPPVDYGNGYCGYPPVDYGNGYCGYPPVDYGNGYYGNVGGRR